MDNRLEEIIERFKRSGQSEQILLAEFVEDIDVEQVEGAMDEIISAAQAIKRAIATPVLKIHHDGDGDTNNPRGWDNFGTMHCWHSRYLLGDHQETGDPREWFGEHGPFFVALPLYLYEHSGITMSTSGFSCPWDSGQVGWIVVKAEDVRREYRVKALNGAIKQKVIKHLESEVKVYDQYLRGSVWGFTYGDDSCWGFLGDDLEETGLLDAIDAPREVIEAAWEARCG